MKLIGYIRVSTDAQVERGDSLEDQAERITTWCERHGHTLIDTYSDNGVSGAKEALDRPGLQRVLQAISEGSAEGIVVLRLDRLARSLTVQEGTLAFIWNHGGAVIEVDRGEVPQDDPDDPMRTAMRQMGGVFAELERRMIAKRLRDGRHRKRSSGGYWTGRPPFGWQSDAERRELVPDPDEQRVLRTMRAWRRRGVSYGEIAKRLTERGVQAKEGKTWHAMTVKRILER
jgi:DNA invertase Pin-like site-specific DNA recombinase